MLIKKLRYFIMKRRLVREYKNLDEHKKLNLTDSANVHLKY